MSADILLAYDIFTDRSIAQGARQIDFRKVKNVCNDTSISLIKRFELFDIVFQNDYKKKYLSLSLEQRAKIYLMQEDFKSIRNYILSCIDKR